MHDESAHFKRPVASELQRRSLRLLPQKLAGAYFIVAVLWIALSHFWLDTVVPSLTVLPYWQDVKDLIFAGTTAWMLYWLSRRSLRTQQQTETLLRESEERVRLILQNMPVMLGAFDNQNTMVVWNHEAERVTGYSAAVMIGNPQAMALLYPDAGYRQHMVDTWAGRGNDYRDWEWDVTCRDGSVKTVAWSNISDRFPIPGWRAWGIGVDVTDRKRSEMALRENEAFFKLALDFTHIGIWDWHLPTNEVIWNENHARLLGLVPGEVQPSYQAWRDRVHPEDIDRVEQAITQALETKTNFEAEYRVIHPDGSLHWLIGRGRGLDDASGQVIRMMGAVLDFTDRKQAEAQIRQLNQTLEQQNLELEALVEQRTAELMTFINMLPDGIFVVERDTMRMLFGNDALAHLIGWESRHQLAGKTIFECFAPDLAATFAEQNHQVFTSGETLHFQECYTTPSGLLHFDTYKIPLKKPNGEVYALIGSSRNITELVEARQTLVDRTAQLEIVNQELEAFSYSVSHDLRAPLRHISGFVAALTDRLQQNELLTDPKVMHYLEIIQDSSHKMKELIDGLLTLSRVGRRPMAETLIDLNQLVLAVLAQRPEAIIVTSTTEVVSDPQQIQCSLGALPTVSGDKTLLRQVFVNLLDNAIKFTRQQPPAHIEIGTLPDDIIYVRDRGIGFQMAYADQLFGAFQRLHSQAEFEGSGIGLAIVHRIIQRHGGHIWAESHPGQGATFYFKLGDRPAAPS
ncbi:PAS domain-containing sensor histidine kinase [Stenomitos frigidus]|uniref:histidine kinase n=1 Tax=Stenomitos frigidus ULC18 TaxID=2107698 RepID=A0A2T1DXV7_9CYAN|nr:PAS domain S-box protein [Stenomitos frigidus]PSB25338.1 PAS domain-containing sensor histidine kinase [Stenomitos frigidus ULC18]